MVWCSRKIILGRKNMPTGNKTILAIIPARMGSTRFPGKPLAPILGIPMLAHVWERTRRSSVLFSTIVATCDEEIRQYGQQYGMEVVMTSDKHERASDRCAEAMQSWERVHGKKVDIMVMVQGDEPMLTPEMIDIAVGPLLSDQKISVVNLMAPITQREEFEDPNEIKVVVDSQNRALYFSREPIPSKNKWKGQCTGWKQVCIIPFLRDYLLEYLALAPTSLEQIESIDMLRILEHGGVVQMVPEDILTYSVDTPEDLKLVEEAMKEDPLVAQYRARYI